MTLPTVLWVAALLQVSPETSAEPWRPHEAECQRREDAKDYAGAADACRQAFAAVPDGPLAFNQRSLFAFKAVRLYKKARKATDEVALLCPAAALLRGFEAQLGTLPPSERPRDRADVAEALRSIEPQIEGACAVSRPDDLLEVASTVKGGARADRRDDGGPAPGVGGDRPNEDNINRANGAPEIAPPARPPVLLPADATPPKRRPLRIAGGATLGVGLGLGTAAIAMIARAANMQAQVDGLNARFPDGVLIPTTEAQRFDDLTIRGERADRAAIGLGVPAIALVLSGIALLATDAHRERSTGRRVALHPGLTGLRITMEF